jgi:2-C-methyl-D-erythritol 4-phosphate cytidylyltransferase / 2-C-methyl-D-erythritol 2,4-cyclodiphosphate synthase
MPAALLLTAAGSSTRFKSSDLPDQKKEYLPLQGMPVLCRALLPFLENRQICSIAVTVPGGDEHKVRDMIYQIPRFEALLESRTLQIIAGGKSRQESILAGLIALESPGPVPELVLIHDAARPWVSPLVISEILRASEKHGGAVPVVPSTSAMKEIDSSGKIIRHLPRQTTVEAQTPQGFRFKEILRAHRELAGNGISYIDDAEIFGALGAPVVAVEGDPSNRKITYRSDLQ